MAKNLTYKGKACSADSVKKRVDFQGIQICVDRPKGSIMKGTDGKGRAWERTYKYDYGFIPKTLGGDDDGLDVFIGPNKDSEEAYWAIQTKPDGSFDEYKIFLGFPNRDMALGAYKQHIPQKLLHGLVTMKVDMMKAMLRIAPGGVNGLSKVAMYVAFQDELDKISEASKGKVDKALDSLSHAAESVGGNKGKVVKAISEFAKEKLQ